VGEDELPKYKVMDRDLRDPDLRHFSHLTPVHCYFFSLSHFVVL
jgi:hypothetical protein